MHLFAQVKTSTYQERTKVKTHPCMHLFAQLIAKEVKWFTRWCWKKPLGEMPEKGFVPILPDCEIPWVQNRKVSCVQVYL